MLNDAVRGEGVFIIGSLPVSDDEGVADEPMNMAVLVRIEVNQKLPDGRSILIVSGVERVRVHDWDSSGSYPVASYKIMKRDVPHDGKTIEKLLKDSFECITAEMPPENRKDLKHYINSQDSLEAIIDVMAQHVVEDETERRYFLEEQSDANRASRLLLMLEQITA